MLASLILTSSKFSGRCYCIAYCHSCYCCSCCSSYHCKCYFCSCYSCSGSLAAIMAVLPRNLDSLEIEIQHGG